MTLAIPLASSSQLSPDRSLTALASTLTAAARIRIPIAPLIDIPESLSMSLRAPTSAAIRTITPERPLASSSQSSSAKDLTAPARSSMAIDSRIRPAAISVNLSAALTPKILLKPAIDPMSSPNRTVIAPMVAASRAGSIIDMISTAAARISIAAAIFSRADALTSRSIALTLPEMPSRISVMPLPVLLTNSLSTSNNLVGSLESPTMFFRHTQIEVSIPTAEPATKPLKISSRVTVLAKLPSEVVILSKISEMNLPNAWSGP